METKTTSYLALVANCEKIKTLHKELCEKLEKLKFNEIITSLCEDYDNLLDLRTTCEELYEEYKYEISKKEVDGQPINCRAWECLEDYLFDLDLCCQDMRETFELIQRIKIPALEE